LVLHAWWGLNDALKAFCTRLADAGFVVFAPDLYQGQVAETVAEAELLAHALDNRAAQAHAEIAAARSFLVGHASTTDRAPAVIGFSLGAYYALELAVRAPAQIGRVVIFYGTRPGDDYGQTRMAFLGHFAETDEFEPRAGVDALEADLRRAGCAVDFYHYPDTGHWFFEPDRPDAFNAAAADLAWARTLAFLQMPAAEVAQP
jgi:carboxymethylenebutenolidase